MNPLLTARSLSVTLETELVLDRVTFACESGEFLAILGGNGSGKTTLLRALLGLVPISAGTFSLTTDRVAYMPQRLPSLGSVPVSVKEFVASGQVRGFRPAWIGAAQASGRFNVRSALEAVGMWSRRNSPLDSLSGGQQRLVMFARTLVGNAKLVMLDEPSAGVDSRHQGDLLSCLSLMKSLGVAILYVTHELSLIESLVDKALVLQRTDAGSVAYLGALPLPRHFGVDIHHHHDETVPSWIF